MNLTQVLDLNILTQVSDAACIYCAWDQGSRMSCCGENHFEGLYEDIEGNTYLESEITENLIKQLALPKGQSNKVL